MKVTHVPFLKFYGFIFFFTMKLFGRIKLVIISPFLFPPKNETRKKGEQSNKTGFQPVFKTIIIDNFLKL